MSCYRCHRGYRICDGLCDYAVLAGRCPSCVEPEEVAPSSFDEIRYVEKINEANQ